MHRPRYFFRMPSLAALALLAFCRLGLAAQFAGMYTATVPDTDPQRAQQDAMRAVLVRLTGAREAGGDPALAAMVADAGRYVQIRRATTGGAVQISFDGNALRAAIDGAGRTVWNPDRPLLLVLLAGVPDSAAEVIRQRLQSEADTRGLPITIAPAAAPAAGRDTLLAAARKAGGSAALQGVPAPANATSVQWTLATPGADGSWTGSPETGIDNAADSLVRAAQEFEGGALASVDCQISGVDGLNEYTAVLEVLASTPGVADLGVREVSGDRLSLHLATRGSDAALARALAGEQLVAVSADTATAGTEAAAGSRALQYRYQPLH